jgi:hypothetical protein
MRFAYFGTPHIGGTYTVYKSLRSGLAVYGVEVFWLGLGPTAKAAAEEPQWVGARDQGLVLASDTDDDKQQATALATFLESGACEGVFVSALPGQVTTNAMRYVTPEVKRVMIVHNISRGTYLAARSLRDYVHSTVGVSPRIRTDLVRSFGFSPEHTHAIPNAVNIARFQQAERVGGSRGPLRLLSLGRVVNSDKGVFDLPKILEGLTANEARLTIAGDGPDLPELRRRCAHLGERLHFVGQVAPEQVPEELARHDVFVFPSRFEGLPLALIEAMAAGCVPVASRIKGVTDFVVRDGEDGLLFDIGDVRAAAKAVAGLAADRDRLARLSLAARRNTAVRFNLAAMAGAYFDILSAVITNPPAVRLPLPMVRWAYSLRLRPGLRTYLPLGVKNWMRLWRERLR